MNFDKMLVGLSELRQDGRSVATCQHRSSFMYWTLIFQLSWFAVAMGFGTVFFIPSTVEAFFWLVIFVIFAYLLALHAGNRVFLHGLLLGIVNSVWMTSTHILSTGDIWTDIRNWLVRFGREEAAQTARR
jgi:hypothetical protein